MTFFLAVVTDTLADGWGPLQPIEVIGAVVLFLVLLKVHNERNRP